MGPKKEKKEKPEGGAEEKPKKGKKGEESTTAGDTTADEKPEKGKKGKKDKGDDTTTAGDTTADEKPKKGKKDKGAEGEGEKPEKGKKDKDKKKSAVAPADSINPFVDLPTAPPTAAPSKADAKKMAAETSDASAVTAAEPMSHAGFGPGQGAPPMGGKPGWRRVSTRQWIRDFRDHIGKFQTFPYKPIVSGSF